jgi:hypothetical protein
LRTILSFFVVLGLGAVTMIAADQTWTGTISDSMCGASHKSVTEHGGKKMSDRDDRFTQWPLPLASYAK